MTQTIADRDVRARELHQKILISAQLVAQNLWEMCSSLKEMRDDKLYKSFGYANFEDYCEKEVGLKRRQAYQYISIADRLSLEFVQSTAQIGVEKFALLASISDGEREQVMEETDVESVTVRELKEQIRTLRADKERLETDLSEADEMRETLQNSLTVVKRQYSESVTQGREEQNRLATNNRRLVAEKESLAAELEDLRNNPMPEDKYRIAAKKHDKDMMEFREQMDRNLHDEMQKRWDLQAQFDDFRKKQQDIIADMERQLQEAKDAATPTVINMESEEPIFEAYLAMAQDVLNRTFIYAAGCGSSHAFLERLDDLLLSISTAICDEITKEDID
ncbi:MAG: hypothetical protein II828_08760 [Clostridia bacterium]|nr:hypothetical protein [Clostridia bacterium]